MPERFDRAWVEISTRALAYVGVRAGHGGNPYHDKMGKFTSGSGGGGSSSLPLESTNPTGGLFVNYDPKSRTGPVSPKLTTLDKIKGVHPNTPITVYRGAPRGQSEIVAGDFITTNKQLAKDYAGTGHVLQKTVPHSHVVADPDDWEGEEYVYRPKG